MNESQIVEREFASTVMAVPPLARRADLSLDVEANQMEVLDKESKAIFRGNVVAKRGNTTLKTDTLVVTYTETQDAAGQRKTEVFGKKRTRDFDEAEIRNIRDDTSAIGVEEHNLHLSANARRNGHRKISD